MSTSSRRATSIASRAGTWTLFVFRPARRVEWKRSKRNDGSGSTRYAPMNRSNVSARTRASIPAGLNSTSFRWMPTAFRFVTIPWIFAIRGSVVAFRWRNVSVNGAPDGVSRQPSPSRSKYPARSSRSFTLSRIVTTCPPSTPFTTRYFGTEALNQYAFAGVTTESAISVAGSIVLVNSRSRALVTATRNAGSFRGTLWVFIPKWRNVKPGSEAMNRVGFVVSWIAPPQGRTAVRSFGVRGTAR